MPDTTLPSQTATVPTLRSRIRGLSYVHNGVMHKYGNDTSGTKEYRFNSLGFRGENLCLDATKRIYTSGCSITFGEGLNIEETWSSQFRELYAAKYGLASEKVNLLNFGESGASNERIARTVLPQCEALKPDLLLIQLSYFNRIEYLVGSHNMNIGQWFLTADSVRESEPTWLPSLRDVVSCFYAFYTNEWGFASTLRSILLLQSYCQAKLIPYLFWWVLDHKQEFVRFASNPVCAALYELVDTSYFCDIPIETYELDRAADGSHMGPQAHRLIAHALFSQFENTWDSETKLRQGSHERHDNRPQAQQEQNAIPGRSPHS